MRRAALYLAGPVLLSFLAPLAFGREGLLLYPALVLYGFPVILVFSVLVALPVFLLVSRKVSKSVLAFSMAALVSGFVAFLGFSWLTNGEYSRIGDVVYVDGGSFTLAGWARAIGQSLVMGLLAVPSGVLWWRAARTPSGGSAHGA